MNGFLFIAVALELLHGPQDPHAPSRLAIPIAQHSAIVATKTDCKNAVDAVNFLYADTGLYIRWACIPQGVATLEVVPPLLPPAQDKPAPRKGRPA